MQAEKEPEGPNILEGPRPKEHWGHGEKGQDQLGISKEQSWPKAEGKKGVIVISVCAPERGLSCKSGDWTS